MLHKCLHNKTPSYLSQKFKRRSEIHNRITRQNQDLNIPKCRLATEQRSFAYRGTKLWNDLPKDLKCINDPKIFKKRLLNYIISR